MVTIGGTYTVKCGGLKLKGGTVEENGVVIIGGTYTVKCGGLKLEGGTRGGIVEENGVDILGGTYTVKCGGLKLEGELLRRMEWTSLEVLILSSVVV